MQYLLLLAHAPDAWGDTSQGDWVTYTRALSEAGVLVSGAGLHAPDTATSVRLRDAERLVTDGPFADTKEHLVGFYVIEVADLDGALDWAARAPNVRTGTVEVRPIQADLVPEVTLGAGTAAAG